MTTFSRVVERFPKALIVASGASVSVVDWSTVRIPKDVAVITTKLSILSVPQATHWITIDHNRCGDLLSNLRDGVIYYAGMPSNYSGPLGRIHFLRRVTGKAKRGGAFGLAVDKDSIHAGNSGYAALGLAFHFEAKKIAILGVDGYGGYFCPGGGQDNPRSLIHMRDLFASAVPQLEARMIKVVNGSPDSIVDCFPKMTPTEAIEWLVQ